MKRSQNATYFAFWGNQWEATAQYYTLLERSFHGQHFTADTMRPSWTVTQHVKLQSWRCWKIVKIQHIWPYRKRPGELTPCHTFLKAPVKTMLSPNWHVTLRLIVFRTFAVKWLFRGPNTDRLSIFGLTFGDPYRHHAGEDTSGSHIYHHAEFNADRLHPCRNICPQTK